MTGVAIAAGVLLIGAPLCHRVISTAAGIMRFARFSRCVHASSYAPAPSDGSRIVVPYTGEYEQALGLSQWLGPSCVDLTLVTSGASDTSDLCDIPPNLVNNAEILFASHPDKASKVAGARTHHPGKGIWLFDIDSRPVLFQPQAPSTARAIQLPSVYLCPERSLLSGIALSQTIWSFGYEQNALRRDRHYLVGHGLYLPPDFPDPSQEHLAEDLELGYRATALGFDAIPGRSIGADLALFPSYARLYLEQSSRWMYGEFAAIKASPGLVFRLVRRAEVLVTWAGEAVVVFLGFLILAASENAILASVLLGAWCLALLAPVLVVRSYLDAARLRPDLDDQPKVAVAAGLLLKPLADTAVALLSLLSFRRRRTKWRPTWQSHT